MAENTVAEAVETLNNLPFASRETTICFGKPAMVIEHRKIDTDDAHAIAALIERQAAEIAKLQATIDTHNELLTTQAAEIAKKDRMIRAACGKLGAINDELLSCRTCCWMKNCKDQPSCADCWLAWLEKEAEEPND